MPGTETLSVRMGGAPEPKLEAPAHMIDGPNGSVIADPSKVVETPAPDPNRPTWLPEKFKSAEDMAKAYQELETKLGKPPEVKPTVTPEAAKAKGVDLDALNQEYATTGTLSEASLKTLEEKGFSKANVEQYIEGRKAVATQQLAKLAETAGGEDNLKNVLEWSKVNLTASEKQGYNALVDAGNIEGAALVLQSIVARYTAANGEEPNLINGERVPGMAGVKPFLSTAQVVDAMSEKDNRGRRRYEVDPAYRADVERRLSVSDL